MWVLGGVSGREWSPPADGALSPTPRTSEKLVKAPRDGCAAGTPGPRCLLCMCVLDVDTAGVSSPSQRAGGGAPASGCWGSAAPEVPSAPLCLQTVPQLLGLRPPRSFPRRSPPSHRLRHPCPAAAPGWAGPGTAAGRESLPCPVSPTPHGWHLAAARGRGCPRALAEGRSCSQRILLTQGGGPPGPCD